MRDFRAEWILRTLSEKKEKYSLVIERESGNVNRVEFGNFEQNNLK